MDTRLTWWQRAQDVGAKAPERPAGGFTQMAELADAIRQARARGARILPGDADALLLNAMAENRPDFGINDTALLRAREHKRADYTVSQMDQTLAQMYGDANPKSGPVQRRQWPGGEEQVTFTPIRPKITKYNQRGDPVEFEPMNGYLYGDNARAYLARAELKRLERRAATIEDALLNGWNGQGRVVANGQVVADAQNHANKFSRMANVPENAGVLNYFSRMLDKGGYDVIYDARDLQAKEWRDGRN